MLFANRNPSSALFTIMSLKLSILYTYLLRLLAGATELRLSAKGVSPNGAQYYDNATDLVTSENLETPFPFYFPDDRDLNNLFPMPNCHGLILEEATVDDLQNAMNKGLLTSTKIALCYLQRIYQTNDYTK